MRRIDALGIALGVFVLAGLVYFALQLFGLDGINAGIWTQTALVVLRVGNKKMTYNQQLKDYEEAVMLKRLEEMSPEELAELQQEVDTQEET